MEEREAELFERREARNRGAYRVFAITVMACICLIWSYRLLHFPSAGGSAAWMGVLMAELYFGLYWIITQSVRWNLVRFYPLKQRLSGRLEAMLPSVDIFVCTADPTMEPPTLVVNTVLSMMSYNYPPGKLSVYVSDDGGSEFTFYALLEAAAFSKHWIPFCTRFSIEPRAPDPYFSARDLSKINDGEFATECWAIKKLYEEMKNRIEMAIKMGKIPEEARKRHKGFAEWNLDVKKNDHHSIVQILIDGRDKTAADENGNRLPTLVYVSREKRPSCPHHFKAGAMNALIRVSSEITNAPFILNVDCDMYSTDPDTVREILCFFMDPKRGHEVAFVQFPQNYDNVTKNDIYASSCLATDNVELDGISGFGAALYCGTGCFHRRESLTGKKYSPEADSVRSSAIEGREKENETRSASDLEESSKLLSSCSYDEDTLWGKEMGLMYGCPVEDIVTGMNIQCRGWKSIYYNPRKKAFIGVAPATLEVSLVQHKRWSEGMSQIFLSKYCPFTFGHGKIRVGAQMGYSIYLLWGPLSLPTLYYVIVPSLCFLHGVSLFPKVSSPWFVPFAYAFVAQNVFSASEAVNCGSTLKGWWNLQRMRLIRRTGVYFIAIIDIFKGKFGLSETNFALTDKVFSKEASKRYEQEIMEFGSNSIMFTMVATLAMMNLLAFCGGILRLVALGSDLSLWGPMILQMALCGIVVMLNLPVYEALFLRVDSGRLPPSVVAKSVVLASVICLLPMY